MKELRKSNRVSSANLRQANLSLPGNCPSKVGLKLIMSRANVMDSKKRHHALNVKPSADKLQCILQINWKCPPKFALKKEWCVAAGEESECVGGRMPPPRPSVSSDVEGEYYDDNHIPKIPIVPIEDAAEAQLNGLTPVNSCPVSQPPSILKDQSISETPHCNLPVPLPNEKAVVDLVHGLKDGDLVSAATAAAAVASILRSKEHGRLVDPNLLIELLRDPKMMWKLVDKNKLVAEVKTGRRAGPEPITSFPLPSSTEHGEPSSRKNPAISKPVTEKELIPMPSTKASTRRQTVGACGKTHSGILPISAPKPVKQATPFCRSNSALLYSMATDSRSEATAANGTENPVPSQSPPIQSTHKIALITGITGQDGSYLTEFLLNKGYEVHGLIRRSSNFNTQRINHIYIDPHNAHKARMKLHYADLTDASSLRRWLDTIQPDEVYNLAAQSHVAVSFEIPDYTADVVATGALRLLEAVRSHISASGRSHIRYYQAGSSEMFGSTPPPQTESSPFHPRSPYAVSKCAAHWYTVNYREAYGIFACNGILFNHESPRRGENFVTRKITRAVGRIKIGLQSKLFLGNLQASRDWGFAGDYVEAMWLMLQQEKPDDYVVATEESHTVEEFLEVAFRYVGLNWKDHVLIDKRYFRPAEVDNLKGIASKAKRVLGWKPKVGFEQLVKMMVDEDIELAKREKVLVDAGYMDAQQQP